MARLAAFFILVSQVILLALVFDFSGRTAILFSFVGHPAVVAGLGLTAWIVLARRSSH